MNNYKNRILYSLRKYSPQLFSNPNIIGFGLGNKIIDGYVTNIPCFTIIVNKKLILTDINPYNRIPKEINGVLTDVVTPSSFSKASTYSLPILSPFKTSLPAFGGGTIKNAASKDPVGGCIAHTVFDSDKQVYILSTADVLTKDETLTPQPNEGDSIVYPSDPTALKDFVPPPPGKPGNPTEIAKGVRVREIAPTLGDDPYQSNVLNAGLAHIGNDQLVVAPGIQSKNEILKKVKNVAANDKVFKYSPKLGKISGSVMSVYSFIGITIRGKKYPFSEQIIVNMPYDIGDRGTLGLIQSKAVVDDAPSVFGMCIGGNSDGTLTYFTPIVEITSRFKVAFTQLVIDYRGPK